MPTRRGILDRPTGRPDILTSPIGVTRPSTLDTGVAASLMAASPGVPDPAPQGPQGFDAFTLPIPEKITLGPTDIEPLSQPTGYLQKLLKTKKAASPGVPRDEIQGGEVTDQYKADREALLDKQEAEKLQLEEEIALDREAGGVDVNQWYAQLGQENQDMLKTAYRMITEDEMLADSALRFETIDLMANSYMQYLNNTRPGPTPGETIPVDLNIESIKAYLRNAAQSVIAQNKRDQLTQRQGAETDALKAGSVATVEVAGAWGPGSTYGMNLTGPPVSVNPDGFGVDARGNTTTRTMPIEVQRFWGISMGADDGGASRIPFDPSVLGVAGVETIGKVLIGDQNVILVRQPDGSTGYYDQQPVIEMVDILNDDGYPIGQEERIVGYGPVTWYPLTNPTRNVDELRNRVNEYFQAGIVPPILQKLGVDPSIPLPTPGARPGVHPTRQFLQDIANDPVALDILVDYYARQFNMPVEIARQEINRIAGIHSPLDVPISTSITAAQQQGSR